MSRAALSERGLIALLAAATVVGPLAQNIYLPVLPEVRAQFGVSVAAAGISVSVPLLAFAFGLLAWGPLSDRHGRRSVLLLGLAINVAGSLVALVAPALLWLTIGRLVQALGSAAGVTVARAVTGDLFGREKMAKMIAYLTMVMLMANSLAPAAGGALAAVAGWRSVFVVLALASTLIWLAAWRLLPETRAKEHRHDSRQLLAASGLLLANPSFVALTLISGAIYAEFFVFVSLMPYLFSQALARSTAEYGLWYLVIAGGYFAGNWLVSHYAGSIGVHRLLAAGVAVSALAALIAWAAAKLGYWQLGWIFGPWFVISFGQGLALPTLTASAVALAPRSAGVAAGLLGFVQQIVGALAVQAMALTSVATPLPVASFTALTALAAWCAFGLSTRAFRATTTPRPG